jgi:hypothetical protein
MRRTTTDGRVLKYTLHGGGQSALGIADEQRRVLFAVVREDLANATRADFEAKHTNALRSAFATQRSMPSVLFTCSHC